MRTQATVAVDDLLERGLDLVARRDFEGAFATYRRAIARAPEDARGHMLLGAALSEYGTADEAVAELELAADLAGPLRDETWALYNNLANALRRAERYDGAEQILLELTKFAPKEWQPWHNLGQLYRDTKRNDEAAAALRRAIALAPEFAPNHALMGAVLHQLDRLHSADAAFNRALALGYDDDPNMWTLYGNNCRFLARRDDCVAALEHALEMQPPAAPAFSNLAMIMTTCGRFDEARTLIDRAVALDPEDSLWRANRGYMLLTAGDLDQGWADWEFAVQGGTRGNERQLNVPRWTPEHPDARVMVYREQGVGDEILFASCYGDLIDCAREVVIECTDRLLPLFARSFPGAEVRDQSWKPGVGETMSDFDMAMPAGSLPQHFRPTVTSFPKDRRSFLVPAAAKVEKWRARFAAFGPGAVVGMSWRSKYTTAERRLEYTRLADDWGPLFAVEGVHWVNLQYDDCERQLRDAEAQYGVTVHRWADVDYMNDFDEVAAIMAACDLVVAPRNAVAMLAGALGVPTVMMGNRWDWADLGTDTSPWFPSVEIAYRHFGEEWNEVIATAARRVDAVAAGAGSATRD